MGKILTYKDIEEKGGHISKLRLSDDSGTWFPYEGDTHCPSAKDWDLRVYNVKNPYSPSSTQCTDTIDTADSYPALFGFGYLTDNVEVTSLDVTFPGINYKIHYGKDTSSQSFTTDFTIGSSGYPSHHYKFYGIGDESGQRLYYYGTNSKAFYRIKTMTIQLSKAFTGEIQVYSGTYSSSTNKKLYNFASRLITSQSISNKSTISVSNVIIPYADYGDQSFLIFIGLTQYFT